MTVTLDLDSGLGLALLRCGRDDCQEYNKRECSRRALASAGAEATGEMVRFPPRSAPLLNDRWVLSLSHSGPWLAVGAARVDGVRTCLGVDVERHKARDFDGIGRFLGWSSRSRDEAHFYRRWTLAEALFKATAIEARRWFERLDRAATGAAKGRICVDTLGWSWRVWWPALVANACVCLVLGVER